MSELTVGPIEGIECGQCPQVCTSQEFEASFCLPAAHLNTDRSDFGGNIFSETTSCDMVSSHHNNPPSSGISWTAMMSLIPLNFQCALFPSHLWDPGAL